MCPVVGGFPAGDQVVLFDFEGDPAPAPSPAEVRATVFGARPSVATFYEEASFGRMTLVGRVDPVLGDVTDWLTIGGKGNGCDYIRWGEAARKEAERAGWDPDAYDQVIHFFPRGTEGCESFAGAGLVGSPHSWIHGRDVRTIAHEVGHNLGCSTPAPTGAATPRASSWPPGKPASGSMAATPWT